MNGSWRVVAAAAAVAAGLSGCGGGGDDKPPPPEPAWSLVGAAGFSTGAASSLAFAADGATLYVAFQDGASGNRATVMKSTGAAWETVGTAGFSAGTAASLGLCVRGGVPHVAFVDGASGGRATVMAYSGGSWQLVGGAGFSTDPVASVALATDGTTLYTAMTSLSRVIGMRYTGGAWSALPGLSGNGNLVQVDAPVSLHAGAGKLLVGYQDYFGGNYDTMVVASYDLASSAWGGMVGQLDTARFGQPPPALASDGGILYWAWLQSPYLSFQDHRPQVVRLAPGGQPAAIGTRLSDGDADGVALAAGGGSVYVAYPDQAPAPAGAAGKVVVQRYGGTSWSVVGTKGFSPGSAALVRLLLVNGIPHVAFQDLTAGGRVTVMKYQ